MDVTSAGHKNRLRVLAMIALTIGAIVYSSSGLIVRQIKDATDWQIVFFRAASLIPATCLAYVIRHRGRAIMELTRGGVRPFLVGPLQGLSSICFVMSLTHTSVASVMLILSATPLFAAGLGWVFLRERVRFTTLAAIGATGVGISLMIFDGLTTGTIVGNLLALLSGLLFACFVIVLRSNPNVDMLPAVFTGAIVATVVAAIVAGDLNVSAHDVLLCVLWGAGVQCTGQLLILFAARHLLAAEVCLFSLIEFVLAPIWVWVFIGEVPGRYAIVGGAIVVLSVAMWATAGASRRTNIGEVNTPIG